MWELKLKSYDWQEMALSFETREREKELQVRVQVSLTSLEPKRGKKVLVSLVVCEIIGLTNMAITIIIV